MPRRDSTTSSSGLAPFGGSAGTYFRLEGGRYQPIPLQNGTLLSRTTGLTFRPEGERLRLVNTATGEPLVWDDELEAALRTAEDRIRALEAELSRLRKDQS